MSATAGTQTNVKTGILKVLANADLTGKEGRLVKLVNDTNVTEAALPTSQNDLALFVLVLGAAAGEYVEIQPLVTDQQVRLRLHGTVVPGAKLVLDVGHADDYGKVKTIPATAGEYLQLGVADQVGADEQLLLVTPLVGLVHVATDHLANVAAAAGACAGGSTPTATQVDSAIATAVAPLVTGIVALQAALEAHGIYASA
jgi:hypothetical protein